MDSSNNKSPQAPEGGKPGQGTPQPENQTKPPEPGLASHGADPGASRTSPAFSGGPSRMDTPFPVPARRRRVSWLLFPALCLIILVGVGIGYRYWYYETHYVTTDNARVTGTLIQVGALNTGRIEVLTVDVGSSVQKDQLLAMVTMPSVSSVAQGAAKMSFLNTDDLRIEVKTPIDGVVVARQANVGDTVAAGQTIVTVINPAELWISANIEETKVSRLRRGQPVEVRVDALEQAFKGTVDTITPATTATFSLLPQQNGSGNFTKITQLVPVKILVETAGQTLPLGGSVTVRIEIRPPQTRLPAWLP
jgi:multidrug resistance efflux pump